MNSRFLQLFLISFLLVIAQYSEGQSVRVRGAAAKYTHFQIPGRVRLEKGDPSGAVVNLINLDSKQIEKSITVPSSGKFDLELSYFKEYKMSVSKDGFYDKDINVSTVIPRNIWDQDSIFPPYAIVITLYKKVPGVQLSFEGKTIGKVSYSPNGTLDNFDSNIFIDDQTIQDEIDNAVKNIGDKDFNQKVAQALEYEKKNELSTAYTLYSEASKIKPSDKFVKEKLKELASDLKNLVNQAKLQAEFNRLIAQGDVNLTGLNYAGAIQNFKDALKVIPNDPIGVSRLSDAERLLALAGEKAKLEADKQLALAAEKAKQDAEFSRLLTLGDESVKQSKFADGIISFKSALTIRPGDSIALSRIADAEKLLALAGEKAKQDAEKQLALAREKAKAEADKLLALSAEKAKQDAEFSRLLTLGDESVKQSKFADGIISFKSALTIRPNDSVALARIANAEKLLALAGEKARQDAEKQLALEREKAKAEAGRLLALAAEKAKQDAEFSRLLTLGDESVKQSKFADGIISFKSALTIRPGDSVALARIADAEKLLALAGEKAKQDAEKQLALAREKAKAEADKLLALAAEKAKQDAEFSRLLTLGDESVKQSKFADGIISFKSALTIRPGDSVALARIANAEKLLALAGEKAKQDAEKQLALEREKAKAEADRLLALAAEKAKQDAEFSRLLTLGDESVKQSKFADGIISFKSALTIRPGDSVALARIADAEKLLALAGEKAKQDAEKQLALAREKAKAEADKLLALAAEKERKDAEFKESEKIRLYQEIIKVADEGFRTKNWNLALLNYAKGLTIRPDEVYPKNKIEEVKTIMASEAAVLKAFNGAVAQGASYFSAKQYAEAITAYREAQKIIPSEVLPPRKIMEIQAIMDALAAKVLADQKSDEENKLSKEEKLYLEKIKIADENFKNLQWSVARFYYVEALKIKQNDNYSLEKVGACDKMIDSGMTAEKLQEYKNKITSGDDQMKAKNYVSARFYYRGASDILAWEAYPKKQLNEIDSIVAKNLNLSDQKVFSENLIKGDDAFLRKEYATARFFYNKAIEISQNDHVASRLTEIESILNGSETTKIDADYAYYIKKGDEARNQKNSAIARFYFQKANSLKPDENYPKQELGKINSGSSNP